MPLAEDIKPYTDADGLVAPWRVTNPDTDINVSGNGVLYTSTFAILAELNGEDVPYRVHDVLGSCEVGMGLLSRGPHHPDLNQWDDYVGYAAFGAFFNKDIGLDMLDWGVAHWGSYNNLEPEKWTFKSFLWRHLALVAHMAICAGLKPNFLLRLVWAASIGFGGNFKDKQETSTKILLWLMCRAATKASYPPGWLEKWAIRQFRESVFASYELGMKTIFAVYFGPSHPFVKYVPEF